MFNPYDCSNKNEIITAYHSELEQIENELHEAQIDTDEELQKSESLDIQ